MRPMRAGGGFSSFFPTRTVAFKLAVALIVCSVVVALLRNADLAQWFLLTPALVREKFALWQLLSYAFIEVHPMGVIFGGIIIWSMGGALEQTWGGRRLLVFLGIVAAIAAALTVATSFVYRGLLLGSLAGGGVLTTAVWLGYGFGFGKRMTNFWGMPVSGNMLAGIGVLFVALNAIMVSWVSVLPEIFAIPLVFVYARYGGPDLIFTRFRAWLLQRKLKARTKHLRVVEKDRNVGGGSDQYLH